MTEILIIVALVILIAFSAFFSGSETAVTKSNKTRLKGLADAGDKRSIRALYIVDHYTRSVSTLLVGNNLVNIVASSLATILCAGWFGEDRGAVVATVGMTILLLIFGETLPKILAAEYCDKLLPVIARPIRLLMAFFRPVVSAVAFLVEKLSPIWTPKEIEPPATVEEMVTMVDTIEEEGGFTEREGELIRSALDFQDATAREILTPRVDIVAFDVDEDWRELLRDENILKYSRVPVYEGSIDNIIGTLNIRRLMKLLAAGEEADIRSLLREPMFVHMTMPISSILKEFRRLHAHMAIVVDEFGGVMGLLTVEDILEEIVGEIHDEYDEDEETPLKKTGDKEYLAEGSMNLEDFCEETGLSLESEDYDSLAGFMIQQLERIPVVGDSVTTPEGAELIVDSMDDKRIARIRIRVL